VRRSPAALTIPGLPQSEGWGEVGPQHIGQQVETRDGLTGTLRDVGQRNVAFKDATGKAYAVPIADTRLAEASNTAPGPRSARQTPETSLIPGLPQSEGWGGVGPQHIGQPVETRDGLTGTLVDVGQRKVAFKDATGKAYAAPSPTPGSPKATPSCHREYRKQCGRQAERRSIQTPSAPQLLAPVRAAKNAPRRRHRLANRRRQQARRHHRLRRRQHRAARAARHPAIRRRPPIKQHRSRLARRRETQDARRRRMIRAQRTYRLFPIHSRRNRLPAT